MASETDHGEALAGAHARHTRTVYMTAASHSRPVASSVPALTLTSFTPQPSALPARAIRSLPS
eukprot:scaffold1371_cov55-Phaeocystis_antarctica.AAC.5